MKRKIILTVIAAMMITMTGCGKNHQNHKLNLQRNLRSKQV